MFKSKKFIITAVMGIAIIGGTIGGAVLADDSDGDDAGAWPGPQRGGNMERVCEIYQENTGDAIDCDELGVAFRAAAGERAAEWRANAEQAREDMHQRLIDEGIVTQEQLDELEAWMEARPERGADRSEFDAWLEARPDVEMPLGPGSRDGARPAQGFGGPRGGGSPRFGGQNATTDA